MKKGPDALGTAENESGRVKRDPTHSVPPKTSLSAQNIKMGPDALDTAENDSGIVKHEQKGPDTLGTAENESG
jgi:hypothetical protein